MLVVEAVRAAARRRPELSDVERKLMDLLAREDLSVDELVCRSKLPSEKVIAAMTMPGIKHLVTRRHLRGEGENGGGTPGGHVVT